MNGIFRDIFYLKKKFQNNIFLNSISLLNIIKIHPFYLDNIDKKIKIINSPIKSFFFEIYYIFHIFFFLLKKKFIYQVKKKTYFLLVIL